MTADVASPRNCEWLDELFRDDPPEGSVSTARVSSSPVVISLGCFCGVKFSIQKLGHGTAHLPFDWVRTRIGAVLHFLRTDFEGFYDTRSPLLVPDTGGLTARRSESHSFWHDDIDNAQVREKLSRRIRRLKDLGSPTASATESCEAPPAQHHPPLLFVRALATTGELALVDELHAELVKQFGSGSSRVFLLAIVGFQTKLRGPFRSASSPGLLMYCLPKEIHADDSEFPYCEPIEWALRYIACDCPLEQIPVAASDLCGAKIDVCKLGGAAALLTCNNLTSSEWGLEGWCGVRSFEDIPIPRQLNPVPVMQDERLTFFYQFLTPEDIDHLITLSAGRWALEGHARMEVKLGVAETPVVKRIEARMASAFGLAVSQVEHLLLVRYLEGDSCAAVHDGASRVAGIFAYLCDVPVGGETRFPLLGLEISPLAGAAIMWRNRLPSGEVDQDMLHESLRVGPGCIKYGLKCCAIGVSQPRRKPRHGDDAGSDRQMTRDGTLPVPQRITQIDSRELKGIEPVSVDSATGCPVGVVTKCIVHADPEMIMIPGFLSDAECDHLIGLSEGCWARSKVTIYSNTYAFTSTDTEDGSEVAPSDLTYVSDSMVCDSMDDPDRTSYSHCLRPMQTVVVDRIEQRLASLTGLPIECLERLAPVRYAPGEFFAEHHDGKTRPKTCLIYLNDLPNSRVLGDGDTYFPHLGISIVPRRGTLVMWGNATPEGLEDTRVAHAGRAPTQGVKYAMNCFFNDQVMRAPVLTGAEHTLTSAYVVRIRDLGEDSAACVAAGTPTASGTPTLRIKRFVLHADPEVVVVPGFLSAAEVAHVLDKAAGSKIALDSEGPFRGGTQVLHIMDDDDELITGRVGTCLAAIALVPRSSLGQSCVVRAAKASGICNRGSGVKTTYVCLSERDDVFFPKLGLRIIMGCGDLLLWPNIGVAPGLPAEDTRTCHVHVQVADNDAGVRAVGLETACMGRSVSTSMESPSSPAGVGCA